MKRIFKRLRSSLLDLIRIKSYILRIDRLFKKRKVKKLSINYIDNPIPVYIYITNRKAKFAPCKLRGRFGFFNSANIKDQSIGGTGCRGPPTSFVFGFIKNETEDIKCIKNLMRQNALLNQRMDMKRLQIMNF